MTPEPDNKKKPTGHYLGTLLLVSGGSFTGVFLARQIKEASLGHSYLEFMIYGIVTAAIGLAVIISSRRKRRDP